MAAPIAPNIARRPSPGSDNVSRMPFHTNVMLAGSTGRRKTLDVGAERLVEPEGGVLERPEQELLGGARRDAALDLLADPHVLPREHAVFDQRPALVPVVGVAG